MTTVPFAAVVTPASLCFTSPDGTTYMIAAGSQAFGRACKLLKIIQAASADGHADWSNTLVAALVRLARPEPVAPDAGEGVCIRDGAVTYGGEVVSGPLAERILWGLSEGYDMRASVALLRNLMGNPSKRVVDRLYRFVELSGMTITEDGHLVAYKRVADADHATRLHTPGRVVSIARNKITDDDTVGCTQNMAVWSYSFLPANAGGEADRVIVCQVDPADVVGVAQTGSGELRVCRYQVLADYAKKSLRNGDTTTSDGEFSVATTSDGEFSVGDLVRRIVTDDGGLEMDVGEEAHVIGVCGDEIMVDHDPSQYWPGAHFLKLTASTAAGSGSDAAPPARHVFERSTFDTGYDQGYAAGTQNACTTPGFSIMETSKSSGDPSFDRGYAEGASDALWDGSHGVFAAETGTPPAEADIVANAPPPIGSRVVYDDQEPVYVVVGHSGPTTSVMPLEGGSGLTAAHALFHPVASPRVQKYDRVVLDPHAADPDAYVVAKLNDGQAFLLPDEGYAPGFGTYAGFLHPAPSPVLTDPRCGADELEAAGELEQAVGISEAEDLEDPEPTDEIVPPVPVRTRQPITPTAATPHRPGKLSMPPDVSSLLGRLRANKII